MRLLPFIVMAGLAARICAALLLPDQSTLLPDAVGYRAEALSLLTTGYIGNPYVMPLYPLLIAITGPGLGQLCADIAISVTTIWLVYSLSFAIFDDRRAANLSALAMAGYPPLIYFAVVGLSETLFIALSVLAFLCWYRGKFTLAALAAILAIMTRPIFDFVPIVMIFVFSLIVFRQSWRRAASRLLVYIGLTCALMWPWWVHNYNVYSEFVRLTPGFGAVLWAGNNPMNKSGGGNVGDDYTLKDFEHIKNPAVQNRALQSAAIHYMIDHPRRTIELSLLKLSRMWRPWPRNDGYQSRSTLILTAGSFLPVFVFSLVYLFVWFRNEWRRTLPIVLLVVLNTAIFMLLIGTIRYRLPLEPFLIVLASTAIVRIYDRIAPSRAKQNGAGVLDLTERSAPLGPPINPRDRLL